MVDLSRGSIGTTTDSKLVKSPLSRKNKNLGSIDEIDCREVAMGKKKKKCKR